MFKMFKSDRKIEIKQHIPFLIYFVLITIFSIAFDQISKIIAENNLQVGVAIPFIPGFIDFLLTYNLGAAWGMGDGEVWSRVLLCITSWVVALFIPCYLVYRFVKNQKITPLLGVSIAL
ncbi:MAG: signal peptidase II, partial [Candidatus Onthovivens sp.]